MNRGNDITSWQQNPTEHGNRISRPHRGEEPLISSRTARMFCCLPFPRFWGLGRAHRQSVWERSWCCLRTTLPREASGPFPEGTEKVKWKLQPGPGPLSHPTWVTLSPFPLCVDRCFLGYLCLRQAPVDVAQKSVVWVCPHARGEQAGRDGESPGSTGFPGRSHTLRGISIQGGYLSRHMFLLAAEFQAGRSSHHTGQAQLSKLQAGLADNQCHFRASQSMWPMRGAPCSPPRGKHRITTPLPVRPSAGSR